MRGASTLRANTGVRAGLVRGLALVLLFVIGEPSIVLADEHPTFTAPARIKGQAGARFPVQATFPRPVAQPILWASAGRLLPVGGGAAAGQTIRAVFAPAGAMKPQVVVLAIWDAQSPEALAAVTRIRVERTGAALGQEPSGETPAMVLIPLTQQLEANGESSGRLLIVAHRPDGQPLDEPTPLVTSSLPVGLREPVRRGPGLFELIYRAPVAIFPTSLRFRPGLTVAPATEAEVRLLPIPLESLTISAVPEVLAVDAGTPSAQLVATVTAGGHGVPGLSVTLEASPGELTATVDRGDGTYAATYTPPRPLPELPSMVRLGATLANPARPEQPITTVGSLQLAEGSPTLLRISAQPGRVPADGRTRIPLELVLTDRAGNAARCPLRLAVERGLLENVVEAEGAGRYRSSYLPPDQPGLATELELRFQASCGSQPIALTGGLTLEPVADHTGRDRSDQELPTISWFTTPVRGPMARSRRLVDVQLGWMALLGDGLFAHAHGPSFKTGFLFQPEPDAPFHLGAALGFTRTSFTSEVGSPSLSPERGILELEVSQLLVPLLAQALVRWPFSPRVLLSAGPALGLLFAHDQVTVTGIGEDLDMTRTEVVLEFPLKIELLFEQFSMFIEISYLHTLTDFDDTTASGQPVGMQGPLDALSGRCGVGRSLP